MMLTISLPVLQSLLSYMLSNQQVFPYANDVELLGIIHRITFPYRRRVLNSEVA